MTLDPERAAHERAMDEAAGSVPSIDVLLDAVAAFLRRLISMSESQATTLALFVVHTHAIHAAHATPYISVSSAVWRSGKTRCWRCSNCSCVSRCVR
jgi:hypothetical protein